MIPKLTPSTTRRRSARWSARRCASLALAPLVLAGCAHGLGPSDDAERTLRLGQAGDFGLVTIRPLQVVEDSRCAQGTQCIWAGRVRLRAEVEPPIGGHERTLILGEEQQVAGGTLLLHDVTPAPRAGATIEPADYRFVLRYRMPKKD